MLPLLPAPPEQGVVDRGEHGPPGRRQRGHHELRSGKPHLVGIPAGTEKNQCARSCGHARDTPAPDSNPHTVAAERCHNDPDAHANIRLTGRR
jgi:hypothetical protein